MKPNALTRSPGPLLAIASAALFGASTPLAKLLLGEGVSPWLLAGLLYLGSGVGLGLVQFSRGVTGRTQTEAPLRGGDWGWLALVVFFGGVLGPVLLMYGLTTTAPSASALLLNVESLATMAIAWLIFRENVDRRLLLGAFAILAGALVLSWQGPGGLDGAILGPIAIIAACFAWGLDNNLTRKISASDPMQIATIKGLVAGGVNLAFALRLGAEMPAPLLVLSAGLVGLLGYGVSLVLFILALRFVGAARTGAYFSTAPFLGAALSVIIFREPIGLQLLAAATLMAFGVWLHLTENHNHEHAHEFIEHEHSHVHDEHHQHDHCPDDPAHEPHSHVHRHEPIVHRHPHYPDLHHQHAHAREV